MSSTNHCRPFCLANGNEQSGWHGVCKACDMPRWSNGNKERLFNIPGFKFGSLPLIKVNTKDESVVSFLKSPKTVRMIWKQTYKRVKSEQKTSHIEQLLGLSNPPPNREWKDRFEELRTHLCEFGLDLTTIIPDDKIIESTPLLIHWKSVDPYSEFPNSLSSGEAKLVSDSGEDPLWKNGTYEFEINMLKGSMTGGLKDKQSQAIKSILRNKGSLQIIALPTGFGKTRIIQITSSILYKNKQGPSLMISPLVALRDDQREAFVNELEEDERYPYQYKLNSKFITVVEEDMTQIKNDLINGEIGMLCCSPEHILTPGFNQSWMEVFRRMNEPFSTLIIDEAHLIGDWGSSFRSNFLLLGQLMERLIEINPSLRVILQSATITKNERKELISLFSGPELLPDVSESYIRTDLHFNVIMEKTDNHFYDNSMTIDYNKWVHKLVEFFENAPDAWQQPFKLNDDKGRSPLLIYSAIKKHAEDIILPSLRDADYMDNVRSFTGDTAAGDKNNARELFKDHHYDGMVATSAFGMGIDKPDLWTIGYLGLPFTLKGLYQGFGRAARKSNWDLRDEGCFKRNGNCIAIIPDVNLSKSRVWRPELRIGFAAERLWNLIMKGKMLKDKGYMILPILDELESTEWMQVDKKVEDYLSVIDSVEKDDEEFDLAGIDLDDYRQAEIKYTDGRKKSRNLNLNHRMWSLACLQRSGAVSLLGFYPRVLAVNSQTDENITLEDKLNHEGHSGVIDTLRNLGHKSGNNTPEPQMRYAVLRVDKPFSNWRSFLRLLNEGHLDLKNRHELGNKELGQFLDRIKRKECIRKSFAPAIGNDFEKMKDCAGSLESWRHNGKNVMPPVPCSHCISDLLERPQTSLGFWANNEALKALGCEDNHLNTEPEVEIYIGSEHFGETVSKGLIDDNFSVNLLFENEVDITKITHCMDLLGNPLMLHHLNIVENEIFLHNLSEKRSYGVICSETKKERYLRVVSKSEYIDN